jgi:hypothetical protein
VRVLNDGASGPWRVTTSTVAQATADFRERTVTDESVGGFCDHMKQELRIGFDLGRPFLIACGMHELGHKIEREFPRIWVHLDAMDTPEFPCGSDDLHAARRAARTATNQHHKE